MIQTSTPCTGGGQTCVAAGGQTLDIFGFSPFDGTLAWAVALVALAHFAGFLIRGAFGFGSNLPIIILTTWALGPHHAIILVILTATFAQAHLFPQGFKRADWGLARRLTVGVYVGIGLGTYVFASLKAEALAPILGALVILIVLMDRFDAIGRLGRVVDLSGRALVAGLSVVSGFVGTVSGGGGIYFLAPFLRHMCPTPVGFRSTSLVVSGIFMLGRALFVLIAGMIDLETVIEALLLMPVVLLGGWIGGRWFRQADAARFFRGLSLMLLAGAVSLIVKSLL